MENVSENVVDTKVVEESIQGTVQGDIESIANAKGDSLVGNTSEESDEEKYTPNFKYRVLDQEKEMDEYWKGFVKSKEDEEKIRDILTKADGIEHVKKNLMSKSQMLDETNSRQNKIVSTLEKLKSKVDSDELDDFFDAWGINEEKLQKFVLKKLQMAENPELKAYYDAQLRAKREAESYSDKSRELETSQQSLLQKHFEMEAQYNFSRPEVNEVASKFDTMPGRKQGDFELEVLKHGFFTHQSTGKDIPFAQAVNEVINMYQPILDSVFSRPTPKAPAPQVVTQSQVKKNTIPNVTGSSSTSPTKKTFTSIADLEEEATRLINEGR